MEEPRPVTIFCYSESLREKLNDTLDKVQKTFPKKSIPIMPSVNIIFGLDEKMGKQILRLAEEFYANEPKIRESVAAICDSDIVLSDLREEDSEEIFYLILGCVLGKRSCIVTSDEKMQSSLIKGLIPLASEIVTMEGLEAFLNTILKTPLYEIDVNNLKQKNGLFWLSIASMQRDNERLLKYAGNPNPFFRASVLVSQLGQLISFLTHDPKYNEEAVDKHEGIEDETAQFGDALIQLIIYMTTRNINLDKAYRYGVNRMVDQEWKHPDAKIDFANPPEEGIVIYPGKVEGRVVYINETGDERKIQEGDIVVTRTFKVWMQEKKVRIIQPAGALITETGGPFAHPANICREFEKVGIVSCEKARELFPEGVRIKLIATATSINVEVLEDE